MRSLLTIVITLICLAALTTPAHAQKRVKPATIEKERLVLMPMRLNPSEQHMQGAIETALVQGLQQKYEVFSGDNVAKKVNEIFKKESLKKDCDETRCLQDISIAFQAELIASANITKIEGGYLLALSIRNVATNKAEFSNSVPCRGCDSFQVVEKLKELSSNSVQAANAPTDNGITPVRTIALPAVPTAPRITGKANDVETEVWAEVVAGNKVDDYKLYLDSYPQGKYAKQATEQKQKLEAYAKASAAAVAAQEHEQAWNTAQQGNSVASYTQYLNQYPQGSYAALSKIRKNKAAVVEEAAATAAAADAAIVAAKAAAAVIPGITANMIAIPGKNYEMGKYEVTQIEWRVVMGNNPSHFSSCGDTCPVEEVSWDDVQIFLQKVNAKSGRQYRLPTEAEWEYACYGGSQTEYCGSNDINAVAWYGNNGQPGGNSNQTSHPVGQKQANGYGLYDMSGNVWEWQSDCWDGICAIGRVLRGGSWSFTAEDVRAAFLYRNGASNRDFNIGFRLARTLP